MILELYDNKNDLNLVKLYFDDIKEYILLDVDEGRELIKEAQAGNKEARDKFIASNLLLVAKVANSYLNRGLPYLDLLQEGNIGLMKALDEFDLNKKCKFSTYAVYWIRQAINVASASKSRNIRIPTYLSSKINEYMAVFYNLKADLWRDPSVKEMAETLNITEEKSLEFYKAMQDTLSLNILVGEYKDLELGDVIPSEEIGLEDIVVYDELKNNINVLIESIPNEFDRLVIRLRYGLIDNRCYTLNEIGSMYGYSRERIRQFENRAKKWMKLNADRELFRGYLYYFDDDSNFEIKVSKNVKNNLTRNVFKNIKTIYEYFFNFSKEAIDLAINSLSEHDKKLIRLNFGDDLNIPVKKSKLSKEDQLYLYGHVLEEVRSKLRSSSAVRTRIK